MRRGTEGATLEVPRSATPLTIREPRGDGYSVHSRWLTYACTKMPKKRCLFWNRCLGTSRPPGSARPAKFLTVIRHSRRMGALRKPGRAEKLCGRGEPLRQRRERKMQRAVRLPARI